MPAETFSWAGAGTTSSAPATASRTGSTAGRAPTRRRSTPGPRRWSGASRPSGELQLHPRRGCKMGRYRCVLLAGAALAALAVVPGVATAAYPGSNGRIAFSSDQHNPGELRSINDMTASGRDVRPLTSDYYYHSPV